jgi:uncharacterized protein
MPLPGLDQARQYVLDRLARELSPLITYHSLAHTRDEVVPAADRYAAGEGVTGESVLLLRTAALYHDAGYVEQHHDHEEASVRIATAVLPSFGYTPAQIEVITGIILATRLSQEPRTLQEQIMVDADLSILGQANYLARNAALREEWAAYGRVMTDAQWYGSQLQFMRDHHYFTATARLLCEAQKQINITALAVLLAQCTADDPSE